MLVGGDVAVFFQLEGGLAAAFCEVGVEFVDEGLQVGGHGGEEVGEGGFRLHPAYPLMSCHEMLNWSCRETTPVQ